MPVALPWPRRALLGLAAAGVLLFLAFGPAAAQPELTAEELEIVRVDWLEELVQGGVTMVALGALSVAMVVFIIERALLLRSSRLSPPGLAEQVIPLFPNDRDRIRKLCHQHRSPLGEALLFLVDHRRADPQLLITGASDIVSRAIGRQMQRTYPLAVIASLAPLLGLLGTMIGMIEAFKLVEVFGDEGGASMLAGSISKALITTAVGLVLAIPSLVAYHFYKTRVHDVGVALEQEIEKTFNAWFLRPQTVALSRKQPLAEAKAANAAAKPRPAAAAPATDGHDQAAAAGDALESLGRAGEASR